MTRIVTAVAFLTTAVVLVPTARAASPVTYDIAYVRQPRYGDNTNTTWPEVFHPARIDPGADLMLLHPDGSEERLVAGGNGAVTDPFVSFDAQWVYYSYFYDVRSQAINNQRDLPYDGADIFRIHLATRRVEQLTFGEFTPNTGAGHFDESNPVNPPSGYDSLGYGILNLAPAPVAGGKVAFTSNRNGFIPPKGYTNPTLQLFVMDEDGGNITQIAPMNISSALHPTPLRDGRLMFSSHESQGLRDARLWGIWSIEPDGRHWQPLMSAFRDGQAFHFMTQLSNDDLIVVDYYNLNNNGFGALYRRPLQPPPGLPAFYSAFVDQNPSIAQTVGAGFSYPFRMPFTPRGLYSIVPFTHGNDEAAPVGANGVRVGRFTQPSGAPNNDLLVVWSPGPANGQNRPTPMPYYDAGLYLIPGGDVINSPADLLLIKNDPNYNEAWPRAVVPYRAIHGVDEPALLPWLPNDGSVHAELPAGTPYGLVGTSSLYKRESFPGFVVPWSNTYDGLDVFNTSENGQSSNWVTQGSDAGKYSNSDIWAIRILAMEPGTHRSYGPHGGPSGGPRFFSHAMERLRILGEIPVRKFNPDGSPILDPEGNPDTSFLVKIPADTPFTFQTLDRNALVLNMAQTWHQVRPGEARWDCGGCHAHSQQPLSFAQTYAARPDYAVADLSKSTPLLTKDASGNPAVRVDSAAAVNVEFFRDIRPLLQRSCVPCHTRSTPTPPGNLVLDDYAGAGGLPGDYARLADDAAARWGYPPLVGGGAPAWRQTNASRYIRQFQSRRSLLVSKIFGQRLDGWANADHPTESVPGDASTLPHGAAINDADLDYTGTIMPPPGSGVPPLSDDEKMLIARWIDLGAPIDTEQSGYGWFLDEIRPTVTVSLPRPGNNPQPVNAIRFGVADADSGLDASTLSVTADFPVAGRAAGSELAGLAAAVGDGMYAIALSPPLQGMPSAHVHVAVADRQGNFTRVNQHFSVTGGTAIPTAATTAARTATPTATATATRTSPPTPTATSASRYGITGHVWYYGSAVPVDGVTLQLTGSASSTTLSDVQGGFGFSNLARGNWQLELRKSDAAAGAITAFDAVYMLQAAVGMRPLDSVQRLACDVSGDGNVSAFDAALVLRYRVGLVAQLPVVQACGFPWLFVPAATVVPFEQLIAPLPTATSCRPGAVAFQPLAQDAASQDFTAMVFGDCTGNWQPGAGTSGGLRSGVPADRVRLGRPRHRGRRVEVAVFVDAPATFHAVEIQMQYDPTQLTSTAVRLIGNARVAAVASHADAGHLRVALASAGALTAGPVAVLELSSHAPTRGALQLEHAEVTR